MRSQEKADQILTDNPSFKGIVDFAIVTELSSPGAFDAAFQSQIPFTDIIHVASPYYFTFTDAKTDMLDPAINGTRNLLEAAKKYASTVRRVVLTSSFAAMNNPLQGNWPSHTYSEEDWNPITYEEAIQSSDKHATYQASKKFSELAAWEFIEKEKPNFDLVVICPPQILGPMRQYVPTPDSLNTSSMRVYTHVRGDYQGKEIPPTGIYPWVDVRDAALAHVRALEVEEAGGQRFFTAAGLWCINDLIDVLKTRFPELIVKLASGGTQGELPDPIYKVSNNKSLEVLGLRYNITLPHRTLQI